MDKVYRKQNTQSCSKSSARHMDLAEIHSRFLTYEGSSYVDGTMVVDVILRLVSDQEVIKSGQSKVSPQINLISK